MKIIVVSLNLALESGNPRLALSLAQTYKSLGHEVIVYTTEFDPKCFPELNFGLNIKVISPVKGLEMVGAGTGFFDRAYRRLQRIILNNCMISEIAASLPNDVDLLDCQNDDSYKVGLYYKKVNPQTKVVWVMYNPPFFRSPKRNFIFDIGSRILAWWEYCVVLKYSKGIDFVITDDKEKEVSIRKLGLPVASMPIPVDFDHFYASVKKDIASGRPIILLGAGGLSPTRRFEDIIAAVAILRRRGYNVAAKIICKDYWHNEDYRRTFSAFLKASGVEQYVDVRFEGAREEEFVRLLKNSDIFIFPSSVKIFGMTVFEAMAAGLPVVVSRSTSVVEFLRDGENALFVDPQQPNDIAAKVQELLDKPIFYEKLSGAGQQYVKKNFLWTEYAQRIIGFPIEKHNK